MICPKCPQQHLKEKYVSRINLRVDYCLKCKGIWFDAGELAQAMSVVDRQLQIPRNAVRLQAPCPKCDEPLHAFHYPRTHVTIEMCRNCRGLWLDPGEFKEIRSARKRLEELNGCEESEKVSGAKGVLIRFIDSAIDLLLS